MGDTLVSEIFIVFYYKKGEDGEGEGLGRTCGVLPAIIRRKMRPNANESRKVSHWQMQMQQQQKERKRERERERVTCLCWPGRGSRLKNASNDLLAIGGPCPVFLSK